MDRIGVRELRQHASQYLDRVAKGETLEITDRGRPVARLAPLVADPWEDMVTSGLVTLAQDETSIIDESPQEYDVDASALLAAMRADER